MKQMQRLSTFTTAVMAVALLVMTSCGNGTTPPTVPGTTPVPTVPGTANQSIVTMLQVISEAGVAEGLRRFAKSNPAVAIEASDAIKKSIDEEVLPYLNGGPAHTAGEVKIFLSTSLFNKLNPLIKDGLSGALALLDMYLKIPDAATFLTDDKRAYAVAFFTGMSKGCSDFRTNQLTRAGPPFRLVERE